MSKRMHVSAEGDASERFNIVAEKYEYWRNKNLYYHNEITRFYKDIIPKNKNILEVGSADGYLLNELCPNRGVGVDISAQMIDIARKKFPHLNFVNSSIENYSYVHSFDYIVLSNILEFVSDLYIFFSAMASKASPKTKMIITSINPLWEPAMKLATRLKMRIPVQMKNFVTSKDIENMLNISGWEVIESNYRMFSPVKIPLISFFLNKLIPRLPVLKNLCIIQFIIAKPKQLFTIDHSLSCSVIIPCHNEEGNIEECIDRIPSLGSFTEVVVVDDGSNDKTATLVKNIQSGKKRVRLISYTPNKGKGHAVKTGFESATGDILIILDADMAVLPEELSKFYMVLASSQAEFINGTRMLYDMAPGAMKFINYLGNKIFGIILSFIIGQRNTDTLCGTKAFYNSDYMNFKMRRCPWGDFDLLFEAARMKLKTVEMPVHYFPRREGRSKMKAFKHGLMLLKMCWYGFWYLG